MKYISLSLRFPPASRHPIHQFIDESDAVQRDVLVYGQTVSQQDTLLFFVEGEQQQYAAALEASDRVLDFDITAVGEGEFYCLVNQKPDAMDDAIFNSFYRQGVIIAPPVEFLPDGVAELTIIGDSAALQSAIAALPDVVKTEISRIGEFNWRQSLFDPAVTDRQQEVLHTAVSEGYYEVPRGASVETVAESLDCSSSTTAEHLRKAERNIIKEYVNLSNY